jgi:hypothetical protein
VRYTFAGGPANFVSARLAGSTVKKPSLDKPKNRVDILYQCSFFFSKGRGEMGRRDTGALAGYYLQLNVGPQVKSLPALGQFCRHLPILFFCFTRPRTALLHLYNTV